METTREAGGEEPRLEHSTKHHINRALPRTCLSSFIVKKVNHALYDEKLISQFFARLIISERQNLLCLFKSFRSPLVCLRTSSIQQQY